MFILNPAYDVWQVEHVLSPAGSDPQNLWQDCRVDTTKCDSKQLRILKMMHKKSDLASLLNGSRDGDGCAFSVTAELTAGTGGEQGLASGALILLLLFSGLVILFCMASFSMHRY